MPHSTAELTGLLDHLVLAVPDLADAADRLATLREYVLRRVCSRAWTPRPLVLR